MPGVLQCMGSQRVGHNLVTKQQQPVSSGLQILPAAEHLMCTLHIRGWQTFSIDG